MFFIVYGLYFFVFFFQAEDGIRDRNVTGVQTCASDLGFAAAIRTLLDQVGPPVAAGEAAADRPESTRPAVEIGRASCREKWRGRWGAGRVEKRRERGWGRRGDGAVTEKRRRSGSGREV